MKEILRKVYYIIISVLPAKLVVNFENIRTYKRPLSKKNPEYFGEKIQWLKLYGNLEQYADVVDKYKVREYVSKKIGKKYLIPLIGVFDSVEDINYDIFPNSFVLKNNNGSTMNIIVKDKSKLDIKKTNKTLKKWLNSNFYKIKKENQYKNVKNRIICEKYVVDKNEELLDYKFFCFDGKPEFFKVDYDRYTNHTANYYDMNWNRLQLKENGFENNIKDAKKPDNFDKMIELAGKLSEDYQFVRVDLYNVDGKIYFGELTFTPASGKNAFIPLEKDREIAKKINIINEK